MDHVVALGTIVGVFAMAVFGRKLLGRRSAPASLDPDQFLPFPLVEKRKVSPDTAIFRFGLPSPKHRLGLPIGQHIYLKANIDGEDVQRSYTPITSDDEAGYFELMIKVYYAGVHPKFPNGGKMSQHLDRMKVGDSILVRGPHGRFEYLGRGKYTLRQGKDKVVTRKVDRMAMMAGGTGVTPMLQLVRAVLKDPEDRTEMWLLFGNQTEADILLREELEQCAKDSRFHLALTVDRPTETWPYFSGFINLEMITKALPDPKEAPVVAIMCGPLPMITHACKPNLAARGYAEEQMVVF
jgi:cytochrome-b5 reductase